MKRFNEEIQNRNSVFLSKVKLKKDPDCAHLFVKNFFPNVEFTMPRRKNFKFFPSGNFFSCVLSKCLLKCHSSRKLSLH